MVHVFDVVGAVEDAGDTSETGVGTGEIAVDGDVDGDVVGDEVALVAEQVVPDVLADVKTELEAQVGEGGAFVSRVEGEDFDVVPFVSKAVVVAGALKVGRQNVARAGINEIGAVFRSDVIVGKIVSLGFERDRNPAGIVLVAINMGRAAVHVGGGQFLEVAAKLRPLLVINDCKHERLAGGAARLVVIGHPYGLAAQHQHGLGFDRVGRRGEDRSAWRASQLIGVRGAPRPTGVAGQDGGREGAAQLSWRLLRDKTVGVLRLREAA